MTADSTDARLVELERRLAAVHGRYVRLFSHVSHDLRAPLGVILGALGELDCEGMPPLAPEQRLLLTLVRRSATRLSRYAADLLELSRLDSGGFALRRQDVDIATMAREAVARVRAAHEGHPATIELTLPPGEVEAYIDGERITHALANLVEHALRFARGRVAVAVSAAPDEIRFEVGHDGSSLEASELADRLEPTAQTEPEKTPADLGLALAGEVVRAHGGTVHVDGGPQGGIRVVCVLPRRVAI